MHKKLKIFQCFGCEFRGMFFIIIWVNVTCTACLNPMYDDNDCLFGGNFIGKGTKAGQVVVSSSECLKTGNMDDIEVKTE